VATSEFKELLFLFFTGPDGAQDPIQNLLDDFWGVGISVPFNPLHTTLIIAMIQFQVAA